MNDPTKPEFFNNWTQKELQSECARLNQLLVELNETLTETSNTLREVSANLSDLIKESK